SPWNVASGTASTRPRPKSGVVRRCATVLASAGTTSPTKLQSGDCGPLPLVWMSDTPPFARGSNLPLAAVPKRDSSVAPAPPTAPALWHFPHDVSLKTGPRPSPTSSTSWNVALPVANCCCWVLFKPAIGPPSEELASSVWVATDGSPSSEGSP